jgi:hypothetical protein
MFEIKYLYIDNAQTVIQNYWKTISAIMFFNLKYGLPDNNTVCIWHIKHKP